MIRNWRWLAQLLVLVPALVAAKYGMPMRADGEAQGRLARVLSGYLTKEMLTGFVGVGPSLCISCSSSTELCEWRAGKREQGWKTMAPMLETKHRVNLLCELPKDGSARGSTSCSAYPRLSNRDDWEIPSASLSSTRTKRTWDRVRPSDVRQTKQRFADVANGWIAASRTLVELSRLVGAAPDECIFSPLSPGQQVCVWRATKQTLGHGTLAMSIQADMSDKVRMSCELPVDGSPRPGDSCFVEVGS